jgi:hypothetical protein
MFMPTNTTELAIVDSAGENQEVDEVELQVQRILGDLEAAAPEVQLAIYTRLLIALAGKLTAANATKAITAAKVDPLATQQKQAPSRSRGGARKKSEELGRIESRLSQLADPTDPIAAWHLFGASADSVRAELKLEPVGVLQALLRHDNMPPGLALRGETSASLADAITKRLEQNLAY